VIRGVASLQLRSENLAAIFIDGVFVSGREGLNFSQLDIERIEVVKGPQAALYGRNSFSGAINYVTARPTNELDAKFELTVGSEDRIGGSATFSGPIVGDVLKGRIALLKDEWDGSYENALSDDGIGGYDFETAQGSLLWTPNEQFEGLLSLYVSNDQFGASPSSPVTANCENQRLGQIIAGVVPVGADRFLNFCGELPGLPSETIAILPNAIGEDRDLFRASLNLTWDTDIGTFAALSGYSSLQQSFFEDASRSGATNTFTYRATGGAPVAAAPGPISQFSTGLLQIGVGDETEEYSQELRYSSPTDRPFRYSVGAYFFDVEFDVSTNGVIAQSPLPADFLGFCPCFPTGPGMGVQAPAGGFGADATFRPWFTDPAGGARDSTQLNETQALSGFAYVEFDFAERWTARLEGRYTDEERKVTNNTLAVGTPGQQREESWGFANWRATVDFKPQENWMVYGAIASARNSGRFTTARPTFVDTGLPELVVETVDPEKILGYELGTKTAFVDGRVSLDAAVFWLDWTDIVVPQVTNVINGRPITALASLETNAGEATVKGVELALSARATDRLEANIGVAWTDGEFDDAVIDTFRLFPTYAESGGQVAGNQLLRQVEWQGNAGATYSIPAPSGARWYARGDVTYRGEQYADASNQTILPEQTFLNASLGYEAERWEVELWGRNLTDEDAPSGAFRDTYFTNTLPNGIATTGTFFPLRYSVVHPRLLTYGATFRVRF